MGLLSNHVYDRFKLLVDIFGLTTGKHQLVVDVGVFSYLRVLSEDIELCWLIRVKVLELQVLEASLLVKLIAIRNCFLRPLFSDRFEGFSDPLLDTKH